MERFFFCALLILSSCASVRQEDLAVVAEVPSIQSTIDWALASECFREGNWPSASWWESFGDAQLNHLMEEALAHNPSLHTAQARIEWGIQLTRQQRSTLLPKLHLEYEEAWEHFSKNGFVRSFYPAPPDIHIPANVNQIDLTLNFDYEFDFWGKNRKHLEAALGVVQTRIAEKAETELVLTTYLTQVYLTLQARLAQQEILEQWRQDARAQESLQGARTEEGIDSQFPWIGTTAYTYFIEQLLLMKQQEIALDRHLIGVLIGQGPEGGNAITFAPTLLQVPSQLMLPEEIATDLLARRPDLQAQIWRIESASKEIGAAKRAFYPNVNLRALGGLESLSFSDLWDRGSLLGGLLPAIHLPLFTGGALTANLRSKVAEYNEMVHTYHERVLYAAREVADSIVRVERSQGEVLWQQKRVSSAASLYQLQELRFDEGISARPAVLENQEAWLSEKLMLIEKQKDQGMALISLIKALGGGYVR